MDDDTTGETVERDGSTADLANLATASGDGAGAGKPDRSGVSRRWLRGAGAVGAAAVGVAAGATIASASEPDSDPSEGAAAAAVPFRGEHQAGIVTPAQDRLHFAAFDVITDDREKLVELLQKWSAAAERMTEGHSAGTTGAMNGPLDAPPADTGEAYGLPPSQLTITIGFGPTLFTKDGQDRFGLAERRPEALIDLPHFPADRLDPAAAAATCACRPAPTIRRWRHAVRNLARIGFRVVGHSSRSASVGRRRPPPHRSRLGTCSGSRTGPRPQGRGAGPARRVHLGRQGRRSRRGLDGRRFLPGRVGSACTSRPGIAPRCASRR